jgi:hypothetical protein
MIILINVLNCVYYFILGTMYFRRNKFKFKFNKSVTNFSSNNSSVSDNAVNLKMIMKKHIM